MKKIAVILVVFFLFFGCAFTANEGLQRVMVRVDNNIDPESTMCRLQSNKGSWHVDPRRYLVTTIDRSSGDLKVQCVNASGQRGTETVESEMQWEYYWMNFFLLDACTISCIIDYSSGAFFEYPDTIFVKMDEDDIGKKPEM